MQPRSEYAVASHAVTIPGRRCGRPAGGGGAARRCCCAVATARFDRRVHIPTYAQVGRESPVFTV